MDSLYLDVTRIVHFNEDSRTPLPLSHSLHLDRVNDRRLGQMIAIMLELGGGYQFIHCFPKLVPSETGLPVENFIKSQLR